MIKRTTMLISMIALMGISTPLSAGALTTDMAKYQQVYAEKAVSDINCLSIAIYSESRGEPDKGKFAVGSVIMNRVGPKFGNSACSVVYSGNQFTGIRERKVHDWSTYNKIKDMAVQIYHHEVGDVSLHATYFHTRNIHPAWEKHMIRTVEIGNHIFFRG